MAFTPTTYMGLDGMVWWQGVVEDRNDPSMLGRCRVRILGWHSEDKVLIPTEELPWAFPLMPINSSGVSGIRSDVLGPVEGSWVFGFFRDGISGQEPVMFGVFAGMPVDPADQKFGFSDPRPQSKPKFENQLTLDASPKFILSRDLRGLGQPSYSGNGIAFANESTGHLFPWNSFLGESDLNRLARNEGVLDGPASLLADKLSFLPTVRTSISSGSSAAVYYTIPSTSYNSVYPFNHVNMTESGHCIEFDDTPGAERIHVYHRTGTNFEFQNNGDFIKKTVGSDYEMIYADKKSVVYGRQDISISKGQSTIINGDSSQPSNYAGGFDYHLRLGQRGNYRIWVEGDDRTLSESEVLIDVQQNARVTLNVHHGDIRVNQLLGKIVIHQSSGSFYHSVDNGDYVLSVPNGSIWFNSGSQVVGGIQQSIRENEPSTSAAGIAPPAIPF